MIVTLVIPDDKYQELEKLTPNPRLAMEKLILAALEALKVPGSPIRKLLQPT